MQKPFCPAVSMNGDPCDFSLNVPVWWVLVPWRLDPLVESALGFHQSGLWKGKSIFKKNNFCLSTNICRFFTQCFHIPILKYSLLSLKIHEALNSVHGIKQKAVKGWLCANVYKKQLRHLFGCREISKGTFTQKYTLVGKVLFLTGFRFGESQSCAVKLSVQR